MKKVKIAFWIVVFGFVALVIGQNWKQFFGLPNALTIDFYVTEPIIIGPYPNALFFVVFFFLGLLITYFFSLFKHYKDAKIIKALKAKESSLIDTISTLERQVGAQGATVEPVSVDTVNENIVDGKAQEE